MLNQLKNKMISTCPKCQSQYEERDNFCIECGKNLKIIKCEKIKKQNEKNIYF